MRLNEAIILVDRMCWSVGELGKREKEVVVAADKRCVPHQVINALPQAYPRAIPRSYAVCE
jgi:hypothetical protein